MKKSKEIRIPSDVVTFVFAFCGAGYRFPYDIPEIHNFFYKMYLNFNFLGIFDDFIFDESCMYKRCEVVYDALDTLQLSYLIYPVGVDLRFFEVSKALAECDPYKLFNEDEVCAIKEITKFFKWNFE